MLSHSCCVTSCVAADADWFDAMSKFDSSGDDRDTMLAEVDQLVKELGAGKGPWIPEPPLAFAGEGLGGVV